MKAHIIHLSKEVNTKKVAALDGLSAAYTEDVRECVQRLLIAKKVSLARTEYQKFFAKSERLSSQLQKCARHAAVGVVVGWMAGVHRRMDRVIQRAEVTEDERRALWTIRKYALCKPTTRRDGFCITQAHIDLYWSWVWDVNVSGERPCVRDHFPMQLSEDCLEFKKVETAQIADVWVNVSCLTRRKRIALPLAPYPKQRGLDLDQCAKSVLLKKRQGCWTFQFVQDDPVQAREEQPRRIAVDVGLNVLAATSDGRLFGQRTKPKFDALYLRTKQLRANRQRQGLKHDSPRLEACEARLSGFLKTEINRVANQLVKKYPETSFVIEDLDLRGCRGQKRFAYKKLHHSLENKAHVITVNPAYTSQQCPSCGYISRQNRSGVKFQCRSCHRLSHADVVGAVNLLRRSEDQKITVKTPPHLVRTLLTAQFRDKRTRASGRIRAKAKRPRASAPRRPA